MASAAQQTVPVEEVGLETAWAVERFLSLEARLLDEENYDAWLALLAPDIRYVMPIPLNTYRRNRPGSSGLGQGYIYDETFEKLKQRAMREDTGMVWLNDPPTRHIRVITNVETTQGEAPGTLFVRSKFMLFRSRRDHDLASHVGWREDTLVRKDGGFRIAKRVIHLGSRVVTDKNLNMFF